MQWAVAGLQTMNRCVARGFTLLEMIVVLVILGLALVLVMTHGPVRSPRLELDAEVRQVASTLRLARSRAIVEEQPVTVAFGTGGYRLGGDAPVAWIGGVTPAGDRAIIFTPDGGSSGGLIVLRGGEREVAIGIDWLTGRVLVR